MNFATKVVQDRRRRAPAVAVLAIASALAVGAAPADAADVRRAALDLRPATTAVLPPDVAQARRALRRQLGRFAALNTDPRTGAVRMLARLDGSLTGPSLLDDAQVARNYVELNARLLGLEREDILGLRLTGRQRLRHGVELVFTQALDGVPAIDSSLRAVVDNHGQLLSLGGAPRHLELATTDPAVPAAQAYAAAAQSVTAAADVAVTRRAPGATRTTTFANGDSAELVVYEDGPTVRLGWRVFLNPSSTEYYDVLVDARTGAVQRRRNLVRSASALVYGSYPGAPTTSPGAPDGGVQTTQDIGPFLNPLPSSELVGPWVRAVLDPKDLVTGPGSGTGVAVPPTGGSNYLHRLVSFAAPPQSNCPLAPPGCTWNPFSALSWQTNRRQDATQLFYYVNVFLQYLREEPNIEFNGPGSFQGSDPIVAQAMDGADTGSGARLGLPDSAHHSRANMLTLPDGTPGYLQSYLFDPAQRATSRGVSASNDASIVYHEVTHGMLNRLVTDAQGFGALDGAQAGAINEGLADWYALDFLVAGEQLLDEPGLSIPSFGSYPDTVGLRTESIGCTIGEPAPECPGTGSAGPGGYTYGDLGRIAGTAEVHADGEIWGQAMWQLRRALIEEYGPDAGVDHARRLISDALTVVPPYPSFLDMRNAMLLADAAAHGGVDRELLWQVFAARGMGYFASTEHGDDAAPIEDFSLPPSPAARVGSIRGTVREVDGGPQGGVLVGLTGHDSGLGDELSATTAADGTYTIDQVAPRVYPFLVARGGGGLVEAKRRNVAVGAGTTVEDFALRRDLAASAAGAAIVSFDGNDNSGLGCGPAGLIDTGHAVWGSESPRRAPLGARSIVVKLPRAITLGTVEIDPTAGCGDPPGSSLGRFRVEVSADGMSYATVADGTFSAANNGRFNALALTATPADVRYVKLVALDSQAGAKAGDNDFMDVAELAVFAQTSVPGGGPVVPGPSGAGSSLSESTAPGAAGPPAVTKPAAVACHVKRGARRVRVSCRLRERRGVVRASVRLTRAGRTVAIARGRVRDGRLPALGLRRAKKLAYRLTVDARRSSGRVTRVVRSISL